MSDASVAMAPRGTADALRRAQVSCEGAIGAAAAEAGAVAVGEMSCPGIAIVSWENGGKIIVYLTMGKMIWLYETN